MFRVKNIENNNKLLNYIHISSDVVSCKIYPNLGGSLQQLSFKGFEVIHGIDHSLEGLKTFNQTYSSAFLFPFSGRIEDGKYKYKNNNYQLDTNDPNFSNALHGLIFDQSFDHSTSKIKNNTVIIDLQYISDGALKGFPFPFHFKISYHISQDGICLHFTIENTGDIPFPFGLGWHPYFYSKNLEESDLLFSSESEIICNDFMIPVSSTITKKNTSLKIKNDSFDTTYKLANKTVIFKTEKYSMEMNINNRAARNYLQIYTPKHRNSIAIEPTTCSPNVFNNKQGLKELLPKETFQCHYNLNFLFND